MLCSSYTVIGPVSLAPTVGWLAPQSQEFSKRIFCTHKSTYAQPHTEGLRGSTAEQGTHPVCTAGEMGAGQGKAGSRENDHPDACQHRRVVKIRCQIMKVWKERAPGCLGNHNRCGIRRGQKIKPALSVTIKCSLPGHHQSLGVEGGSLPQWLAQTQAEPRILSPPMSALGPVLWWRVANWDQVSRFHTHAGR